MSKKGLPLDIKMRHDAHYVEEFARSNRSVGRKIQIGLLAPNPNQPRTEIGDLTELAGSIASKGVLEPILVKPIAGAGRWMIIAGERRWRAANIAGLTEVPCIELDIDEKDIAEIALIENLQRKDLTVWEEADGFAYLIKKFDYTHEEIAKKIGKSRSTVTESLSLAGLPQSIRDKCFQANINTKSALLEVARQFDEKAMHDFLARAAGSSAPNKSIKRGAKTEKKSSDTGRFSNPIDDAKNSTIQTFTYVSPNKNFNLQLNFKTGDDFDKTAVLNALKEVFNSVKNQLRE